MNCAGKSFFQILHCLGLVACFMDSLDKLPFGCTKLVGFQALTRQFTQALLKNAHGKMSFCRWGLQNRFQQQFARFSAYNIPLQ